MTDDELIQEAFDAAAQPVAAIFAERARRGLQMDDKAQPGTPAGDKLEVLATLVDAYEREHIEIPTPDPIAKARAGA